MSLLLPVVIFVVIDIIVAVEVARDRSHDNASHRGFFSSRRGCVSAVRSCSRKIHLRRLTYDVAEDEMEINAAFHSSETSVSRSKRDVRR